MKTTPVVGQLPMLSVSKNLHVEHTASCGIETCRNKLYHDMFLNLQVFPRSPAIPQQLNEPIDQEQRKSSSSPEWLQRATMGTRAIGSKVR